MTVPTAAGKTLSSLRFALYHAEKQKKQRIIYIAPYTSILEQNAEEIRSAVGLPSVVLEHHCNVICEDGEEERYRDLTETWDTLIIVTTAVQILNTLFSDHASTAFAECIIYVIVLSYLMKCRHSG
ncbi:MAG: DEAD/DEAH box helicase [Pilosibacter sp.]